MSVLCKVYLEELSEGRIPGPDSEEAKAWHAWSWAQEKLSEIKESNR